MILKADHKPWLDSTLWCACSVGSKTSSGVLILNSINININTSISIKIIHITITLILIITINIVLIIIVIILTAAMTDLAVVLAGIGAGEVAVHRTCVPDDIFQALQRQVLRISSCSIIYLLPTCMLSSSSGSS